MSQESKTYNGWANYETWCVNLWMDNDEGSYAYWREAAQEQWENPDQTSKHWSRSEAARFSLADKLKSEHEEAMPDLGASVWGDILSAAFSEVDWDEIADHLLNECEDEADDDEGEEGAEKQASEKYESRS